MEPGLRFRMSEGTGCGSTTVRFEVLECGRAELALRARWMGSEFVEARVRGRLELAEHGRAGWLQIESVTGRLGEGGEELSFDEFDNREPMFEFVLVPPTPNFAAAGSGMADTPSAYFNETWELALWEHPMARCHPDECAIEDPRMAPHMDADFDAHERHRESVQAKVAQIKRFSDEVFERLRLVRLARVEPGEDDEDDEDGSC